MADTMLVLNDLLVLHYRSLPVYLTVATPWTHRGDEKAIQVVKDIVEDQQAICRRVADLITQRGGIVDMGEFPTDYTDTHFLSLEFMIKQIISAQHHVVEAIAQIVERLWNDPPAQTMAKEALGAARGHLQSLEEMVAEASNAG